MVASWEEKVEYEYRVYQDSKLIKKYPKTDNGKKSYENQQKASKFAGDQKVAELKNHKYGDKWHTYTVIEIRTTTEARNYIDFGFSSLTDADAQTSKIAKSIIHHGK